MLKNHQMHLNVQLQDLRPIVAGHALLEPGEVHPCTDSDVSFTAIFCLTVGSGVLQYPNGTQSVRQGQTFILFPGENGTFCADHNTGCAYRWVGFVGSLSSTFTALPRIFNAPKEMFPYLEDTGDNASNLEFRLASDLFFLYAELIQSKKHKIDYVQLIKNFVAANYMHEITLQRIADHVGLNPHYLSRLFKNSTGSSLQSYILQTRLLEAEHYLQLGYSTKEAAHLSGFNDTSNFSKLFKKSNGISPAAWKKEIDRCNSGMIANQQKKV